MPRKAAPWGTLEKLQVALPSDIVKQLDALAESRLMSRSDIIREALLAYLKGLRKK